MSSLVIFSRTKINSKHSSIITNFELELQLPINAKGGQYT